MDVSAPSVPSSAGEAGLSEPTMAATFPRVKREKRMKPLKRIRLVLILFIGLRTSLSISSLPPPSYTTEDSSLARTADAWNLSVSLYPATVVVNCSLLAYSTEASCHAIVIVGLCGQPLLLKEADL